MARLLRSPIRLCCLLLLGIAGLAACSEREPPAAVNLEKRTALPTGSTTPGDRVLNLCVGSMITPQDGYVYYRQLIDYLAEKLKMPIQVRDPGNYREVNRLLETGETDVAFVCGGPYIEGRARFGLALIAAPIVHGSATYYSNLIVPAGSPAQSLKDLQGKTFAFTDPQSNSGYLVPVADLAALGASPETFFSSHLFTYAHDRSIRAVAEALVDGAAVDSLIWDFLAVTQPALTARAKVISRRGPFGIPPVVASPHLDAATAGRIREVLLTMHQDPRGRQILQAMLIDRFDLIDDAAYDSIRRLLPGTPAGKRSRP